MEADYRASPTAPSNDYDKARKRVFYFTSLLKETARKFDALKYGLLAAEGLFHGAAVIPQEPKEESLRRLKALKQESKKLMSKLEEAKLEEYESAPSAVKARMNPPEEDEAFVKKLNSLKL